MGAPARNTIPTLNLPVGLLLPLGFTRRSCVPCRHRRSRSSNCGLLLCCGACCLKSSDTARTFKGGISWAVIEPLIVGVDGFGKQAELKQCGSPAAVAVHTGKAAR